MKLNIGSSGTRKDGYHNVDIRSLPEVDFVCPAWAIPVTDNSIDSVYSRHMIEHLTLAEARRALREWLRILKPGCEAEIICPNLEFHLNQYFKSGNSKYGNWSNYEHAMAGLYGWQQNSQDTHKWGWTNTSLIKELSEAGFSRTREVADRECDCYVIGVK